MKIAVLSFTKRAGQLSDEISLIETGQYDFIAIKNKDYPGGVKAFVDENWNKYQAFIFIAATGIAVRYIKNHIVDKKKDPAILVIDDMGRYVISLLSGHLGGANELAEFIAGKIRAQPVITTATDGRNIEAVDMFAKRNNYYIEDMAAVKDISSLMLEDRPIGIYTEEASLINYPGLKVLKDIDQTQGLDGLIIVSSSIIKKTFKIPTTILRPRNINIGIGCRRGVEAARIIAAIEVCLEKLGLSRKSLRAMATVEVKKDEQGIIEAANHYGLEVKIFSLEEISRVDHLFTRSDFVKKTIGVYSVSEPAAYLLGGHLILEKSRHNGITISISRGGSYE